MEKNRCCLIFLLAVLIIASFLRFWQLDLIPPGLYPDVAMNGNDALDALKTGNFKVFYPENNGREGLFINLIALSFAIFGPSVWAIKIVAAIAGILTVFGFYLLAKELFSRLAIKPFNHLALLSAFLLATSFWHLNFSRFGFRAIMVPFILVWSFYLLFLGLRQKKLLAVILAGVVFGLGFHTYIAFRMAPLILPAVFIPFYFAFKKKNLQKKYLLLVISYLLSVFIIALPIGLYFLQHPADFIGRATGVSVFAAPYPVKAFFESLLIHLQMFVFKGDFNWRHNLPGQPAIAFPLGIFLYLGLIFSVKEAISALRQKNWQALAGHSLLLSWFFAMLLPGILTSEGIPHQLRTIGVIPVAYLFVSLGILRFFDFFHYDTIFTAVKKALLLLFLFVVLLIGLGDVYRYFFVWAKSSHTKGAFTENYAEIGNFLNSLPENVSKYVIVNEPGTPVPWPNGIPMPSQTPMFIERARFGRLRTTYLLPKDLDKMKPAGTKTIIVLMKNDQDIFKKLQEIFPLGKVREYNGVWRFEAE